MLKYFFNKIRLFFTPLFKGYGNIFSLIELTNQRGHNNGQKIIGWVNGCPAYSIMTPPAFSQAQVNLLATKFISLYQWRKLPELISIAVTDKCNCSCKHCSFVSMKKNQAILNTEEIKNIIVQAQQLGVATVNFVGGEPLLREDIVDLVKFVDKRLSQVVLFTNGYFLAKKIKDLKKAGLTSVVISIDAYTAAQHDEIRGLDGLFAKALIGIKEARKAGLLVGISAVIDQHSYLNKDINKIIEWAKEQKVNEVMLFDAVPTGRYSCNSRLLGPQPYLEDVIKLSTEYNQKKDYPGIYSYSYVKSNKGLGCLGGVSIFYVSPYGDICPCDFNPYSIGNVREKSLFHLWDKLSSREASACSSFDGCKMQNPEYRQIHKT